jgi:hypothetical protein
MAHLFILMSGDFGRDGGIESYRHLKSIKNLHGLKIHTVFFRCLSVSVFNLCGEKFEIYSPQKICMIKTLTFHLQKLNTRIKETLFKHYIPGLYNRIGDHHILMLGGALAFSFFICIIPMILIIFSIIGNIFAFTTLENKFNLFADKIIPYKEYADFVKKFIINRVEEFEIYRNIAGYLGT